MSQLSETRNTPADEVGVEAWIPWELARQLPYIQLREASTWQVFLLVFTTWCRHGREQAWLSIEEISQATGLPRFTVTTARAELISLGLLEKTANCRGLAVNADALQQIAGTQSETPNSSLASNTREAVFTARQLDLIDRLMQEIRELLVVEPAELFVPPFVAASIGVPEGSTYWQAFCEIQANGNPIMAHKFTSAVIALRNNLRYAEAP